MPVINMPQDPSGMVPDWLNPYVNPQSGQESGWPIDANAITPVLGQVAAKGMYANSVWNRLQEFADYIPQVKKLLEFLKGNDALIQIQSQMPRRMGSTNAAGVTNLIDMWGDPVLTPGLKGAIEATDASALPTYESLFRSVNPYADDIYQTIGLNKPLLDALKSAPEVTLYHELNHTNMNLMEREVAKAEALKRFQELGENPMALEYLKSKYSSPLWGHEANAQMQTRRAFNPYIPLQD